MTGVSGGVETLGGKLKSKGSVRATVGGGLKNLGKKIIGTSATTVDRPGASRVFSVGASGEAAVTGLDEAGTGVIAGTGLKGLAGKGAAAAAAGFAKMGAAASKAGGLITSAMSGAATWIGAMAGKVNLAAIKTALFAAGTKLAALATKVWAGIQAAFNIVMDANPIVLVGLAIAALVAGVIYAYTHFKWFRDAVNDAFHGIAAVALWLWHHIFDPVWHGIEAGAKGLYTNGIKPWLNLSVAEIRALQNAALWLWHNVFDPVWHGIQAGAKWLYSNGIKPWLDLTVAEIRVLQNAALWMWHNVFDPLWHGLVNGAKTASKALGMEWALIKRIFEDPVKAIVNLVYNNGIVKVWDAVASLVGLKQLKPIKLSGWSKGGVLPGYEPGVDRHVIAVSGGEGILVPEAVQGIGGPGIIDAINYAFAGHRGAGKPGGADGHYVTCGTTPLPAPDLHLNLKPIHASGGGGIGGFAGHLIGDAGAIVKKGLGWRGAWPRRSRRPPAGSCCPSSAASSTTWSRR